MNKKTNIKKIICLVTRKHKFDFIKENYINGYQTQSDVCKRCGKTVLLDIFYYHCRVPNVKELDYE